MVSCPKLPGVRSFVLDVGSWSGNRVPINLYQRNVILCHDKKGQGPKVQLSPSKVPVLAKRRQSSVDSSFRARSPDSVISDGARCPGPSWHSGCLHGGDRSCRLHPKRPLLLGRRDQDGGEAHCCLKAWAKASGWPLKPCRTQPRVCSLGPPAHPLSQGGVNWRAFRRRLGSTLTSLITS